MSMKLNREVCKLCKEMAPAVLNGGWFDRDELLWRDGYVLCPDVGFTRAGQSTAWVPSWCSYAAEHVVSRCL